MLNLAKQVRALRRLLHLIPLLVALFEYVAVSSALAYARFAVEAEPPTVRLLGGLIKVGETPPYDAVPNMVVTLHLLALFIGVVYFVYFVVLGRVSPEESRPPVPPQEG